MDVELRSLPQAARTKLAPRLRNYKNDLSKLKKDLVWALLLISPFLSFSFLLLLLLTD